MTAEENARPAEEPVELEAIEETPASPAADEAGGEELLGTPEFREWQACYLADRVPSLFLDQNLRILHANESFARQFDIPLRLPRLYFTEFFSPFFDESRSAELFRSVRSADASWCWSGRVERIGHDQLLNVSKVWILPLRCDTEVAGAPPAGGPRDRGNRRRRRRRLSPKAYSALCLDITGEYRSFVRDTFASLLGAAKKKDNDTGNHVERVNRFSRTLAEDLVGLSEWHAVDRQFVESIGQVAALHDIGKIGTPDDILNKAGPLDPWEWNVMKEHTTGSAYILRTYPDPMALEIALRHHERWDGEGYPHGLSGAQIPLSARIVAIADVYDALRIRRTYKEPYTHERAVETIRAERGTHFDPLLVKHFLEKAKEFGRIFAELADKS